MKKVLALTLILIMLFNVSASALAEFGSIDSFSKLLGASTEINNSNVFHFSNYYNRAEPVLGYKVRQNIYTYARLYEENKDITLVFVIETEENNGTNDDVYLSIKFESGMQRNYILKSKSNDDFQSRSIGEYYVKLTKEDLNQLGFPVNMQIKKERGGDNWKPRSITVRDKRYSLIFNKVLDFEFTDSNDTWSHSLIRDEGRNFFYVLQTKTLNEPTGDVYSILYLKDGTAIKNKLVNIHRSYSDGNHHKFKKGTIGDNYVTAGYPFKLKDIDRFEVFDDGGSLKLEYVKIYDVKNTLIWDTVKDGGFSYYSNKNIVNIASDNYLRFKEAAYIKIKSDELFGDNDIKLDNSISLILRDGRNIDVNINNKNYTAALAEEPFSISDIKKIRFPLQSNSDTLVTLYIRPLMDSSENIDNALLRLTNFGAKAEEIAIDTYRDMPGYTLKDGVVEVDLDYLEAPIEDATGFNFLQSPYQVSDNGEEVLGFVDFGYSHNPKYFSEDLEFGYYGENTTNVFNYFITLSDEQVEKNNKLLNESKQLGDKRYPQYRFELDLKNAEINNGFSAEVIQYVGNYYMPANDSLKIYKDSNSSKIFIDGKIRYKDVKYLKFNINQDKSANDRLTGTTKGIFNKGYGKVTYISNVSSKEISSKALHRLRNELYSLLPDDVADYVIEECLNLESGFIGDSVVDKLPIYIAEPFGDIISDAINGLVDTNDVIHKNMFSSTVTADDIKDDYSIRYEFDITDSLKKSIIDNGSLEITSIVDNGFLNDDYSVKVTYKDSGDNWLECNLKEIYQQGNKLRILTHDMYLKSYKAVAFEITTKMKRHLNIEEIANDIKSLCNTLTINVSYDSILNKLQEYTGGGDIVQGVTDLIIDNIPVVGTLISFSGLKDNIVSGVRKIFNIDPVENRVSFNNIKLNLKSDANPSQMYISDLSLKMDFPVVDKKSKKYRADLKELKLNNKPKFNKKTEDLLAINGAKYSFDGEVAELKVFFNKPIYVTNTKSKLVLDTITNKELRNPYVDSYKGVPCIVYSLRSSDLSLENPDLLKYNKVNLEELLYRVVLSNAGIISMNENPIPLSSFKHLSGYKTLNVEIPKVDSDKGEENINENVIHSGTEEIINESKNNNDKTQIVLQLNNINAFVNDKVYKLEVAPFRNKITGKTLVPVRFISDIFGAEVKWYGDTQQVAIKSNGKQVLLTINSTEVLVNNKKEIIASPAEKVLGKTFVPLRFVGETLGAGVQYIGETQEIILTK